MKKVIKHLSITILSFILLVILKNQYGYFLAGNTYGIKPLLNKKEVDHLFLGSSIFRQGLDIEGLQSKLGGNVYILSYNGNQPFLMADELEYLIDQGVEINNLYVDMYVYTAATTPWISDTKLFLDTNLPFKIKLYNQLNIFKDFGLNEVYEMFITSNINQIVTFPITNALVDRQFRYGGNLLDSKGSTKEELDGLNIGLWENLNDFQVEGLYKIESLCAENNINLKFVELPKYESMIQDTRKGCYSDLMDLYTKVLIDLDVEIINADTEIFDVSNPLYFQDHIHLSSFGRKEYSDILATLIMNSNS